MLMGFVTTAVAQNYSAAVTLESQTGSEIVVRSTASEKKGKLAEESAVESAFITLFNDGLEGLKNGQPMFGTPDKDYEYKFIANKRYLNYLAGKPNKISETKYGGEKRLTFDVAINLGALLKDMESRGVAVNHAWADGKKESVAKAVDPVIVVVPVVAGGGSFEDMRTLIENDPAVKYAVNTVTKLFSEHGFQTRDFMTALANASTDDLLRQDAQTDVKTMVVQNLPGDIVVSVDTQVNTLADGKTSSCQLDVKAVERQTESILAAENFSSGKYHVQDPTRIVDYAAQTIGDPFFSQLTAAFTAMIKNGRQMNLEFQLGQGVDWDFDTESPATGDEFKDSLEEWLHDNAFRGSYNMGLSTDKFIKATIAVPLWDTEKNRTYKLSAFTSKLKRFLKQQLGDEYKPEVTSLGQRVIITVK